MKILGIDIGGSALKGAPVDIKTGRLLAERHRIETEGVPLPGQIVKHAAEIAAHFKWRGPVGIGFPGVVVNGRIGFVGNLHQSWVGKDAKKMFSKAMKCRVGIINDADAAGLAEMRFGAGRKCSGSVLMLTAGTGIGTALFRNGILFPNCEFGHLPLHGGPAERYASAAVRKRLDLDWKAWAKRFDEYLSLAHGLLWPDLIVVGGGVSKNHKKWMKHLKTDAKIVPAKMHNEAGIVGAALAAAED